ncbi:alpha/beta fold hydrolase [Candidatus Poriferisocius sp.]|uniref:alpha/beta fold hydrolase n=1 Tax=Candidatus Poriferisocius sp. TaxID=3101276 RepID=UPI003B5BFE95
MTAGVVFAHGAFHGPWCWERVQALLENQGVATHASDLGRYTTAEDIAVFQENVDHMRSRLDGQGPVIAVGHSLGGLALSGLRADTVDHLLYVVAILGGDDSGEDNPPDISEAVIPENFYPALEPGEDGYTSVNPLMAGDLFYHDCSAEDVARAVTLLRPQRLGQPPHPCARAAWRDVDATYVVCNDDRTLRAEYLWSCAELVGNTVEFEGSHSPPLAQPETLVALITRIAGQ